MHQTFELFLQDEGEAAPRFLPLTCATAGEVMHRARLLLEEEGEVVSVEVRLAGEHLFTLER